MQCTSAARAAPRTLGSQYALGIRVLTRTSLLPPSYLRILIRIDRFSKREDYLQQSKKVVPFSTGLLLIMRLWKRRECCRQIPAKAPQSLYEVVLVQRPQQGRKLGRIQRIYPPSFALKTTTSSEGRYSTFGLPRLCYSVADEGSGAIRRCGRSSRSIRYPWLKCNNILKALLQF